MTELFRAFKFSLVLLGNAIKLILLFNLFVFCSIASAQRDSTFNQKIHLELGTSLSYPPKTISLNGKFYRSYMIYAGIKYQKNNNKYFDRVGLITQFIGMSKDSSGKLSEEQSYFLDYGREWFFRPKRVSFVDLFLAVSIYGIYTFSTGSFSPSYFPLKRHSLALGLGPACGIRAKVINHVFISFEMGFVPTIQRTKTLLSYPGYTEKEISRQIIFFETRPFILSFSFLF